MLEEVYEKDMIGGTGIVDPYLGRYLMEETAKKNVYSSVSQILALFHVAVF